MARYLEQHKPMSKTKTTSKAKAKGEKLDYEKILGECHDGEDYKLQMKDGSIKIVSKSEVDGK